MRLRDSNEKCRVVSGVGGTWLFVTTLVTAHVTTLVTALVACGVDSVDVPMADSGTTDSGPAKADGGGGAIDSAAPSRDAGIDAAVPTYSIGGTVTGLVAATGDAGLERREVTARELEIAADPA